MAAPSIQTLREALRCGRSGCSYIGGISRNGMYKLMGDKEVSSYLIGTRRYFLKDELDAFLERQMEKAE